MTIKSIIFSNFSIIFVKSIYIDTINNIYCVCVLCKERYLCFRMCNISILFCLIAITFVSCDEEPLQEFSSGNEKFSADVVKVRNFMNLSIVLQKMTTVRSFRIINLYVVVYLILSLFN